MWAPREPWTLSLGPGIEIEHHESVWLARLGTEYAFVLPKDWELSVGGSYEFKDYYDSWGLGLTIGRRFGSRLPAIHREVKSASGR